MKIKTEEILKSIAVQGTLLDMDTEIFRRIVTDREVDVIPEGDVFSKIVGNIVKLCEDGIIDPWYVDINGISRILSSMIDDNFKDFSQAGYLMWQAWHLLFQKSQKVIDQISLQSPRTEEDNLTFNPDSLEPVFDDLELRSSGETDGNFVLREPVLHREKRRILMVELLDAIRKAYFYKSEVKPARKNTIAVQQINLEDIIIQLNPDEPERDIETLYNDLLSVAAPRFAFSELMTFTSLPASSAFVYLMFLVRRKKILVKQEVPYGEIWIDIQNLQ
ncbi:MAG: hypothetical protein ACP5NK_04050 [Thermoplasmata archaeon]